MTRMTDRRGQEETLAGLAHQFVDAMVCAGDGPRQKADAERIAAEIAKVSVPGSDRTEVDERLIAARRVTHLAKGGDWTPGAIEATLAAAFAPDREPQLRPIRDFWRMPEPEAVIWRDWGDSSAPAHSVLAVGEIAVLSGAGGIGKSYIVTQLAEESASMKRSENTAVCGLRVRGGGVVVISYEDSGVRIAKRLEIMGWTGSEVRVSVVDPPKPLFPVGGNVERPRDHDRAEHWARLFGAIRQSGPTMVVIDTGPKAMGGLADFSPGPVIAFYEALEREARSGQFGVLIVTHDTKAARTGGNPGPGGIAGSGQWHDSARGVVHLAEDMENPGHVLLECLKSNHGPRGWGARLRYVMKGPDVCRGLECAETLDIQQMVDARGKGRGGGDRSTRNGRRDAQLFGAGEVA